MSDVPEPLPQTLELSAFSGSLSRVGGVGWKARQAGPAGGQQLVRDKSVADGDLPYLPAGRLIAADPDLDAAEGVVVGRSALLFVPFVHLRIAVVVDAVGAFVDQAFGHFLVDAVGFVVCGEGVIYPA